VYLDGTYTGQTTNTVLTDVSTGAHTVKVIKEGYLDDEQSATVVKEQTTLVTFGLTLHTLTVTEPNTDSIWVTGEEVEIVWETDQSGAAVRRVSFRTPSLRPDTARRTGAVFARNRNREVMIRNLITQMNPSDFGEIRMSSRKNLAGSNVSGSSMGSFLPLQGRLAFNNSPILNQMGLKGSFGNPFGQPFIDKESRSGLDPTALYSQQGTNPQTLTNIRIELYKGTTLAETIVESTENTGSYTWPVPDSLTDGQNYKVKVLSNDEPNASRESDMFWITPGYEFVTKWGSQGTGNYGFGDLVGIAVDSSGNVYCLDWKKKCIKKYSSNGIYIREWGNTGSHESKLNDPFDIVIDSSDKVYVIDCGGGNCVNVYTSNGNFLDKWVEYPNGKALFGHPVAIALSESGHAYVIDQIDDEDGETYVKKLSMNGQFIKKWGSKGSASGEFNNPWKITVDGDGFVYVADSGNHRIQKFTSEGDIITSWGTNGSNNGQFSGPFGIDVDSSGRILVADRWNNRIQKFTPAGKFILTWGSDGSGDNQFKEPIALAIDADGNLFIAENQNYRIVKYKPRGTGQ